MNAKRLLKTFAQAGKRTHLVGDLCAGVIAALDVEGRLFTVLNGEVLNRVNSEAVVGHSTRGQYLNPGGDGLWPAPEGTTLGYQYSTGHWRVPPGLSSARYLVTRAAQDRVWLAAEVDLVNNQGVGIPTVFQRKISVLPSQNVVTVNVVESITYIGHKRLDGSKCRLAPWTLCQFNCGSGCEVVFPCQGKSSVWDLYEESGNDQRELKGQRCHVRTEGTQRYQIAIDAKTSWLEFRDPHRSLTVRRRAGRLPRGQRYIDIRDASPNMPPQKKGVRYSVYCDTNGFMEIEAAGGCPGVILPNMEMQLRVSTRFAKS